MRVLRALLVVVGLASPTFALAAAPSPLLALPADCRNANGSADDAVRVVEACTSGLKSSDAKGEKRAWMLYFRAYAYVEQGRFDDANADLNAAIEADPTIDNLYHELSYVRTELGDYDGAEAAAAKAMQLAPTSLEHPKERAYARLQKGDYAGAAADYSSVLEREDDPAVRQILAFAHALNGDLDAARADLGKVDAKDVANASTYAGFANKVLDTLTPADKGSDPAGRCEKTFEGKFDKESARVCTAAIRAAAAPAARADALRARSLIWLYAIELNAAANSDIEAAVRLNPNDGGTIGQRCIVLTETATVKRQVKRAILDCNRALELCDKTDCKVAHMANRANAYFRLEDYKSALADGEAIVKLQPDFHDGYRIRGEAKLGLGDKDGAKADLTQARRLGGESDYLKTLLAKVGVKMEDIPVSSSN